MNKIYLYFDRLNSTPHGSSGYAFNENAEVIHSHFSSDWIWSQHDLGLNSDWGHDVYKKQYPDGFELIWVDDPNHEILLKSRELAKKARDTVSFEDIKREYDKDMED